MNILFRILFWPFRHLRFTAIFIAVVLMAWGTLALLRKLNVFGPMVAVEQNVAIEETPEEIIAIKNIGQWELLSVNCEEMAERHESRMLGDRHLVRIYYGTIRIGLDTEEFGDDWFVSYGKTVRLNLPNVKILDEHFIDEARTKTFYEEGTFNAETKQELYEEAQKAMKARALTVQNLKTAQLGAEKQMKVLFKALGYDTIIVNFPKDIPEKASKNKYN